MKTKEEIKEVSNEELDVLLDLGSDMMMPSEETPTNIFNKPDDLPDPLDIENMNNKKTIPVVDDLSPEELEVKEKADAEAALLLDKDDKGEKLDDKAINDLLDPNKGLGDEEDKTPTQLSKEPE